MLTDKQAKEILSNLKYDGRFYSYQATDENIIKNLDDIADFVIDYERHIRNFRCTGINSLGQSLLEY